MVDHSWRSIVEGKTYFCFKSLSTKSWFFFFLRWSSNKSWSSSLAQHWLWIAIHFIGQILDSWNCPNNLILMTWSPKLDTSFPRFFQTSGQCVPGLKLDRTNGWFGVVGKTIFCLATKIIFSSENIQRKNK